MSYSDYWGTLSQKITSPVETKNKRPDTSDLEINFLKKYVKKTDEILDIGSGSGLIINKLINYVDHITAVEKFDGFTKFISDHPNMLVVNADLIGFKMRKEFDITLCFGVAQCFKKNDMQAIYKNLYTMTKTGGGLIIRTHCGLETNKIINGYSEELKTNYFAEYRQIDEEEILLKKIGFTSVDRFDIFPDTLNVWKDTRHFILVCKK